MTICLSHGGPSAYRSEEPSNRLLVATIRGVATLERAGAAQSWNETGRSLEEYHAIALAREPESGVILAATHDAGLFVSEDDGQSWEKRTNGIASDNVYCVNYVRTNGDMRLFAGTEPAHLYASDDLGRNWRELASLRSMPSVPNWTFPAPPPRCSRHQRFHPSGESGHGIRLRRAGRAVQDHRWRGILAGVAGIQRRCASRAHTEQQPGPPVPAHGLRLLSQRRCRRELERVDRAHQAHRLPPIRWWSIP